MGKIAVLGSLSTDFVATTNIRPKVGETVQGNTFFTTFGGKGANQAVAASRLGAEVVMFGMVGDDNFGKPILENLKNNGVSVSEVETITGCSSGAALITISESDNSIIYIPGANGKVDAKYVKKHNNEILSADIVIAQNEVSYDSIKELVHICEKSDVKIILNPAPYRDIDVSIIEKIDYIIPNESECKLLFPKISIEEAINKYPNKLIVTMGSKGVIFNNGIKNILVPTYKVETVDTTGAGDTFIGGFSYGISSGLDIEEAIKLGNLAASQSVTKMGAQSGMPFIQDLKQNINYDKKWSL